MSLGTNSAPSVSASTGCLPSRMISRASSVIFGRMIIAPRGHVGQARQAIELGQGLGELLQARDVLGRFLAELLEELLLQLEGPLLGGEHLFSYCLSSR